MYNNYILYCFQYQDYLTCKKCNMTCEKWKRLSFLNCTIWFFHRYTLINCIDSYRKQTVEQTVLLLGKASNSISYYRRFYMVLLLTNSPQQSKQILREASELLQKNEKKLIWEKIPWKHLAQLPIKEGNFRNVIKYISNKIQALSPRPFTDTEEKFQRATKASSQKGSNVTTFEKTIQ